MLSCLQVCLQFDSMIGEALLIAFNVRTGGETAALAGAVEHDHDDTSSELSWSQDPIAEAARPKPLGALHHPSNFCRRIAHAFCWPDCHQGISRACSQ